MDFEMWGVFSVKVFLSVSLVGKKGIFKYVDDIWGDWNMSEMNSYVNIDMVKKASL